MTPEEEYKILEARMAVLRKKGAGPKRKPKPEYFAQKWCPETESWIQGTKLIPGLEVENRYGNPYIILKVTPKRVYLKHYHGDFLAHGLVYDAGTRELRRQEERDKAWQEKGNQLLDILQTRGAARSTWELFLHAENLFEGRYRRIEHLKSIEDLRDYLRDRDLVSLWRLYRDVDAVLDSELRTAANYYLKT